MQTKLAQEVVVGDRLLISADYWQNPATTTKFHKGFTTFDLVNTVVPDGKHLIITTKLGWAKRVLPSTALRYDNTEGSDVAAPPRRERGATFNGISIE